MTPLHSDTFFNDKKVVNAIDEIVESLHKYQSEINGVKPADPKRKKDFDKLIKDFSSLRSGNLFYPYISSGIGKGPLVELLDGSVKYDFISGIGVHYFGHSHPEIVKASLKAGLQDTVMQGHLQQTSDTYRFSKKLLEIANSKNASFKHCFLTSSGAMANENALKLAFQKNYPADRVLAFKGCFSGRTIMFSHITDKPEYRKGIPTIAHVDYVPFLDQEEPELSTQKAIQALKEHIKRHPKKHAAMFFELILGEGGFYEGSSTFHSELMKICQENGITVIADEVQSFARTEEPFAFQYYKLDSLVDAVTIGKSTQVCATLFKEELQPKPGLISQTFTSSTTAIIAGLTFLELITKGDYFGANGKIKSIHNYFEEKLQALEAKYPELIRGPFGVGGMIAFTPLSGEANEVMNFAQELFKRGLISFVAGNKPKRIRFLPPLLSIENKHIDEAISIIEETLLSHTK